MAGFERTCLIFDGHDARAVEAARGDWRAVKAAGLPAKYWAQERGPLGAEGVRNVAWTQRFTAFRSTYNSCTTHAQSMH